MTSPWACLTTKYASSPNFPGFTLSRVLFLGKPLTAVRNRSFFLCVKASTSGPAGEGAAAEEEEEACSGGAPVVTL